MDPDIFTNNPIFCASVKFHVDINWEKFPRNPIWGNGETGTPLFWAPGPKGPNFDVGKNDILIYHSKDIFMLINI